MKQQPRILALLRCQIHPTLKVFWKKMERSSHKVMKGVEGRYAAIVGLTVIKNKPLL